MTTDKLDIPCAECQMDRDVGAAVSFSFDRAGVFHTSVLLLLARLSGADRRAGEQESCHGYADPALHRYLRVLCM
jgi:hypothetical protein